MLEEPVLTITGRPRALPAIGHQTFHSGVLDGIGRAGVVSITRPESVAKPGGKTFVCVTVSLPLITSRFASVPSFECP